MKPTGKRSGSAVILCVVLSGCTYDSNHRCGPYQVQRDESPRWCVCAPGSIPNPVVAGSCVPCGEHERAAGTTCECADGYARTAPGEPCTPTIPGLADPCGDGRPACPNPQFPYCQKAEGATTGYCTSNGCQTSADCPRSYACHARPPDTYCQRPPSGQEMPCQSQADCAGREASYCETALLHICVVDGCDPGKPQVDVCQEGWLCCDTTPLGLAKTLCLKVTKCPTL